MIGPVIVSVSGGLSSIEALERAILKYDGKRRIIPVFADVGSVVENGRVVCGEDEDLMRFLVETEAWLGVKIERIKHPKYANIWECFFARRYMGNTRVDPCSEDMKRKLLDKWIKQFDNPTMVIGFSWLEGHRAEQYKSFVPNSEFPLCEKPYVTNEDIAEKWERRGIKRGRSYDEGFSHDNCGGMCVKMGLGQAFMLWKVRPWRYEYAERREKEFRSNIHSEATIFRKSMVPITMESLRLLFEEGYIPRTVGNEDCGGRCMMPEEPSFNPDEY